MSDPLAITNTDIRYDSFNEAKQESLITLPSILAIPTAPPLNSINSLNSLPSVLINQIEDNKHNDENRCVSLESSTSLKPIGNSKKWFKSIKQKLKISS
jgi:hypothetical protein